MQFAHARSPIELPYVSLINATFGLVIVFMVVAPFLKLNLQQQLLANAALRAAAPIAAAVPQAPPQPVAPPVQKPLAQPSTPLPANPDALVRELGHAIIMEKQAEASRAAEQPAPAPTAPPSYEQRISSWISNYRVYPTKARTHGMQGNGMLLISIDRKGNVHHAKVEASTGHKTLDRAMLQTIRNASPLPPAPDDYQPGRKVLQFKIPVIYTLQ